MSVLRSASLQLDRSQDRAVEAAGGLFVAPRAASPPEIVAECQARGVRALRVEHSDIDWLVNLPDLEFVTFLHDVPDVTVVATLSGLRGLTFSGTWHGHLDFGGLRSLEWFYAAEVPRDGGLETLLHGHPSIHHVHLGRYPWPDLAPLAGVPHLARLSIVDSRHVRSLTGANALAPGLRGLELSLLPGLASLDGIEALSGLEVLEIHRCRQVTDLTPAAKLPNLRILSVFEAPSIDSLKPLAGHPHLEWVSFGRLPDGDLDPLATLPNLKVVHTGKYRFNRPLEDFPLLGSFAWDDPLLARLRSLRRG